MRSGRRKFLHDVAGVTGSVVLGGTALRAVDSWSPQSASPPTRRQARVDGRRITTVDVHAHCFIPDVRGLVKNDTALAAVAETNLAGPLSVGLDKRLADMDGQGIDYQVINVNAWGYSADRALARDLVALQNETIAGWCRAYPTRLVGMATVALQHPEMAADQLEHAVRTLGLRGAAIGGSVEGEELSNRRFDPFWATAEKLGVLLFMHPQPAPGTTQNPRLAGKGGLGNTIGNPLETTVFLSHLIFEGTLDRFPGLRICAAHAGGYLASYTGRSDALCGRAGGNGADCRALRKKPSEYFRRELFVDTMVFHDEGLRHLVAEVGVDQVVYGTDYPFDWPVGIDFILDAPALTAGEKEAILGANVKRLLRIPG